VKEVDASGAVIELAEGVEGYLRASDIKEERVEDASRVLSVGDEIEAKFVSLDRKNRTLSLSVRAKDDAEIAEALKEYKQSNASSGTTSLGDLLKEQLDQET
jgi:small subunit ribosomal protein S1